MASHRSITRGLNTSLANSITIDSNCLTCMTEPVFERPVYGQGTEHPEEERSELGGRRTGWGGRRTGWGVGGLAGGE